MKKVIFYFLLFIASFPALSFVNQFQKPFCIAKKKSFSALSKGLHNASIFVCFVPDGHGNSLIVKLIDHAKRSVLVEAYNFTSKSIFNALIRAKQRGLRVEILLDKADLKPRYNIIEKLKRFNIPFKIDFSPAVTHNKVMVVDEGIVIAGSYNFIKSAELRNSENLIVIKDKAHAKKYVENYEKIKSQSVSSISE